MSSITSGVRHPRNLSPRSAGTIHDDNVAAGLGFRGGAIAGSIHLEQFSSILVEAFGPAWFERGTLSLFFAHALLDNEAVEATLETGGMRLPVHNQQLVARMLTPDGTLVAEGTASVGESDTPTALAAMDRRATDSSQLRMLRNVPVGMQLPAVRVSPAAQDQRDRVESGVMTSPLDWYTGPSPWGGPVCSPLTLCRALCGDVMKPVERAVGHGIGLYGAIELRHVTGPAMLNSDLVISGRVTHVSETPKTEVVWTETVAHAADNPEGAPIAELTLMTRMLKASSPLWKD